MDLLLGLLGIVVLLALGWLLSTDRRRVNWRTVLVAFALQFAFAFLVLRWEAGRNALNAAAGGVQNVINYANEGVNFLFGGLTNGTVEGIGVVFALQVLTIIIFFASLMSVLYYLRIMPAIVRVLGGALSKLLGISKGESLSVVADIFVGQTEAPLVVRPYLKSMTQSELFAVMVGGLASVAGSVLVGYSLLGAQLPYLIAAAFMAAPGALLFAKLVLPERDRPQAYEETTDFEEDEHPVNVIDAAARGAADGLQLALNVGAMLLAFIGLIALLNGLVGGVGSLFGVQGLTIQAILGYVFAPVAFLIGVPWAEAVTAGSLIGQKLVTNEFVAFSEFGRILEGEGVSQRTEAIVTFALCGFANFGSIAILIGGLGGLAPNRRNDIARLGLRAVAAATLANLMSGVLAGMLV